MIYINHNSAMEQLSQLIDSSLNKNLNYMPDNFNEQQHDALELLKKRIFLEEIVEESVAFNRKLNWIDTNKNLKLVSNAEELIEVFKLRSNVYIKIGYNEECPDNIDGLNFDSYDMNSAILYYQTNKKVSGTLRVIFDSKDKLPTDKKFSFDKLRTQYKTIGELSRFVVEKESKGLSLEFKNLFAGVHNVFTNNDIDIVVTAIKKEHYKLYSKFGGTNIEKELPGYGLVNLPFLVMSWNPSETSEFFKRAFLK
jgi:N-acyl-L-homoserine lactone synthetase